MRLDCRGDDGQPLISINQLDGGNVEVLFRMPRTRAVCHAFEGCVGFIWIRKYYVRIERVFQQRLRPPLEAFLNG